MAKIVLGIALAVLLATAALGYLAHENAVKLQSVLATTKQDLATTRTTLAKTKDELKTRTEELAAANIKIEEKDKEIATTKGLLDEATNKLKVASEELEKKTAEVAKLDAELKKVLGDPNDPTKKIDVEALAKQIADLNANLIKAQTDVAEQRALVDGLTKQKKNLEDEKAVLVQYKLRVEKAYMAKGTTGRILAVNGGWNFVVLSIGDKQGAVMNATMLVVRGNEPIAKVRISSVEPSSSIADIIPGSVRKGVTVQPGDSVIFEGRTSVTTPPVDGGGLPPGPALPLR